MNFEEWVKQMSKEALFQGDDENSAVVQRISLLACEDFEEDDRKHPKLNWSSRS